MIEELAEAAGYPLCDELPTMDLRQVIPDARDGLRPVDRRVLFVMNERGLLPDGPYRRSATIVGEARQRFPGQGWRSAYNALARMAQDFVTRYPLIDGQGNFGSVEGDGAADADYTEARLTPFGAAMLAGEPALPDAGDERPEPTVFPSGAPNLLVNGAFSNATSIRTKIRPA